MFGESLESMERQQEKQELEFEFPYHYVPSYKDNFSQLFVWSWSINYATAIEFVIKKIKEHQAEIKIIYDIGCGDGRITKELHYEFNGKKVIGIDYSEKAINLAKAMSPSVDFKCIDILHPHDLKRCDLVTLIEVFEHIPLDFCEAFVRSLFNILKDGGGVFLTVPHKNVPVSYKHFQHFNLTSIEKYFGDYFTIEDVEYIQRTPLLMRVFSKFINNRVYVIKSRFVNNLYYRFYKKYCFHANENDCERMYVKLEKKRW